jgi:pro-kumamolisin-like protein/Big-like domain-containing protein
VNKTTLLALLVLLVAFPAQGQSDLSTSTPARNIHPLITKPLDESQRVVLKGNTHRLARPLYDRGAAPGNLPMDRMLLVLKRSVEQDTALHQLLDSQHDKASPNYHKWLTPDEFGKQFGAADADLQIVNNWLQTHGFQVGQVSHGRTIIEFSGTAAQVEQAFGTAIHQYSVNGQQHWANASDPQIPAALAPVVAGVRTLHSFRKKPLVQVEPQQIKAKYVSGTPPQVTFPGNPPLHALAPADFKKIYNATSILSSGIDGTGVSIAVVARSNLLAYGQDVTEFRGLFGICCSNSPIIYVNGPDPGVLPGGEEVEATLDASWAGAVAPNALIDLVVSASTNTTDGVDLSELYIIDNNLAPIMTESFGGCEAGVTAAEAEGIAVMAEQAAAQGITYLVSSGDSGSAGCDDPSVTPEIFGPSVNMLASSPYTVAVGGTMFNEHGQDSKYWSATNSRIDLGSALSYIPENVWNESCTPSTCGIDAGLWSTGGGSSIFFSKPSWQSGFGPSDGKRDLPDISLTAAIHDPYLLCLEGSCIPDSQGFISFWAVAGTSASAPAFAGIMALVNQQMGGAQGQADYVLYRLAANENFSQCNGSSTSSTPANNCVFNDTTVGNNCVPGETGYPSSCTTYKSAASYDLATGLGSVNISNLVTNWNAATFNATTTTLSMGPTPITHGAAVTADIAVTGNSGMPTGDVSLLTPNHGVPLCTALNACTLVAGSGSTATLSVTTHLLPGGSYSIQANYAGDGNFAPSLSGPTAVIVIPESTNTTLTVASGFDGNGNPIPFTSGPYGNPIYLRANVAGQSGYDMPSGVMQFLDNGIFLNANGQLDNTGSFTTPNGIFTVGVGTRALTANYLGDSSFKVSSSTTSVIVTQAGSTTSLQLPASDLNGTIIAAHIDTTSHGNAPGGTVTFFADGTPLSGAVSVSGGINPISGTAQGTAFISSPISGNQTLTAIYNGDVNYVGSTSPPLIATPDFVLSNDAGGVVLNLRGTTSSIPIDVTPIVGFTGTVTFTCSGFPAETACTFNPVSVNLSPTTPLLIAHLSFKTTAPKTGMLPHQSAPQPWWQLVDGVMFAGVFLIAGARKSGLRKLGIFRTVGLGFLLILIGCGGGGSSSGGGGNSDPGTPIGTYTISTTATSGSITHSTSFQVTVQ